MAFGEGETTSAGWTSNPKKQVECDCCGDWIEKGVKYRKIVYHEDAVTCRYCVRCVAYDNSQRAG
jgi:uncharacterized protein CbrC (UPF0167 family)